MKFDEKITPLTGRRLNIITFAVMLSLFLASIETTVVATAMPTIVSQLGGLAIYAWVFSAYMLASTTMVPIFGKLSDIYGRRAMYLIAMIVFLAGSILCGVATSMEQLVVFRAIQGLGAGGLMPLAFTIIGDIFSFEQRAKMQGWFSGVWGFSSIVGPLVGGFFVDHVSWRWVFLINLPFGLFAAALMIWAWRDVTPRHGGKVDFLGAVLLSGGVIALLLALFQLDGNPNPFVFWFLLATAIILLALLIWFEPRIENPILPVALFRERLFTITTGHGFVSGFALFGTASFIPFYVESVLGTSATQAGATLTPQLLGWVGASVIGSRLLLRFNYRSLAMAGVTALVIGAGLMTQVGVTTPQWFLLLGVALMGVGMGLSVPPFMIAVQSSVPRQFLGAATATVQFSRNIGGTVGVSVMGVILATRLASALTLEGIDPKSVSLNAMLDPIAGAASMNLGPMREALASAMQAVFIGAFVATVFAWLITALAPRGRIGIHTDAEAAEVSAESLPVD